MDVQFRAVDARDLASTRQLVEEAFGSGDTAAFLDAVRAEGCILGEWLAEDPSGALGHIVFSRVWLDEQDGSRHRAAILAPLAVRPDRQRLGIGTALSAHALKELEDRGEALFFVLGHPDYYPRVGFRPASAAGIESPWSGNPAFMVRGTIVREGRLVLPAAIANAH